MSGSRAYAHTPLYGQQQAQSRFHVPVLEARKLNRQPDSNGTCFVVPFIHLVIARPENSVIGLKDCVTDGPRKTVKAVMAIQYPQPKRLNVEAVKISPTTTVSHQPFLAGFVGIPFVQPITNGGPNMQDDERCCGTGTCIIDAQGRCWCGQQWDGEKMCHAALVETKPNLPEAELMPAAENDASK